MPKRDSFPISSEMQELGQRLMEFRKSHPRRTRLPEELWAAAVSLAKREGLYRTASSLQLDYANLKRKAEGHTERRAALQKTGSAKRRMSSTAFVELVAESIGADCLIELEGAGGGRMRIRMKMSTPEVMNLVRYWREGQAGRESQG